MGDLRRVSGKGEVEAVGMTFLTREYLEEDTGLRDECFWGYLVETLESTY